MVLTVYSALSPAIGLFVTVVGTMRKHRRQRDISVEISGPRGLAVRFVSFVKDTSASTASRTPRS